VANKLIYRLKNLGFENDILTWIDRFLANRLQCVTLNGVNSEYSSVVSGVPQGSVLGPLLFLLYINDLPTNLDGHPLAKSFPLPHPTLKIFADDIKIYHTITSRDENAHLQCYVDLLSGWCLDWQLQISKEKCAVLHLGSQNPKFIYTLNNNQLPSTDQVTDLGVVIDQKLDYTAHIGALCLKARSRCLENLCWSK